MDSDIVNNIEVHVADSGTTRSRGVKTLQVSVLADNVEVFLSQIETILDKAPIQVGQFAFTEFVVSAEISAKGTLAIMGTGVETEGKGGLTFKFVRK